MSLWYLFVKLLFLSLMYFLKKLCSEREREIVLYFFKEFNLSDINCDLISEKELPLFVDRSVDSRAYNEARRIEQARPSLMAKK